MKTLPCLCLALSTFSVLPSTSSADEKPRFKGVELYSWKNDAGQWIFALLDGTNRLKTAKEVKEAETNVKGVEELAKAIGRLAMGEQVLWTHPFDGFEYPPEASRKLIEKAAKDANVDLHIASQTPSKEQVEQLKRIWHEDSGIPIEKVPTPEGFKISPANAYLPLRKILARPQWLQWHMYVDSSNYYIVVYNIREKDKPVGREFLSAVPESSKVINGATGKITDKSLERMLRHFIEKAEKAAKDASVD